MSGARTQYVIRDPGALHSSTEDPELAERYSRAGYRVTARTEAVEG